MEGKNVIKAVMLLLCSMMIFAGCKKEKPENGGNGGGNITGTPTVTTAEVSSITETTATCGGNVTADGGATVTARGVCWSTSRNPTISNSHTTNGSGTGTFTSSLTGLSASTTYYVRAYATNEKGTAYGEQKTFTALLIFGEGVTDADGNTYKSVIIGDQEWMAENLKTTKYKDGTAIPNVTDSAVWSNLSTPAYCWYNNDPTQGYGALYNWYAVNTGNLCPTGWHVPSDAEWTALTDYLHTQGYTINNDAIPLKSTTGWNNNGNGTDVYGFTAFPGGARNYGSGNFSTIGGHGLWWSSTEYGTNYAYYRYMFYSYDYVYSYHLNKRNGFSVRCVRD